MIYLTYNDAPSGIYFSQVTDVCKYVNVQFHCNIRLVALISIRAFGKNKKHIKEKFPSAIVLPMFPKNKNWALNGFILKILFLFIGKQNIWSRGLFATNIALNMKNSGWTKKVVFDARGAYKAEFDEYLSKVVDIKDNIAELEKRAIYDSDFRLAVSKKLVNYWEKEYKYSSPNHSIIPCTINEDTNKSILQEEKLTTTKKELGFKLDDCVFVYSGSAADWQSLHLLDNLFLPYFITNPNFKLIILSQADISQLKITQQFSERIIKKWLKPSEVLDYLYACDYGVLIRENSITNKVASPTKFAEYLNAGLNVIISEHLGDFSEFVLKNNCGVMVDDYNKIHNFSNVAYKDKMRNKELASNYFKKDIYKSEYQKIINVLS